jgi:Sec-independent protein secretion pathway component TatC
MGATSTNSLMIKLQPKIYDYIMLTVRISFISSVCSQVPVIVICLLESRGLSVETFTNNRRFLMVFPLLTAALSTPPDIWCQIFACFLIFLIIELAIFVALIIQVREEGWTSGMRESGSAGMTLKEGKLELGDIFHQEKGGRLVRRPTT